MNTRHSPVRPRRDRRPSTVGAVSGERVESGTDVFATLMWGLRRYAVVVLATVVALGVLVPLMLSRRAEVYQATAQVGPSSKLQLPNTNPLPRVAESVFNNGAVEVAVRTLLKQPSGNIIPSKVQLIAAQDNLVLEVVAHARTPEQAMAIANAAAATFLTELNDYSKSVAPFVITHQANLAKKVPKVAGGYASVALGLIAGLLAGIALVGLILVIRRPVVEPSSAQDVTGSPVIGHVGLARHGPQSPADSRATGLLCRRLLATSPSTIQVAAPSHPQAEKLADLMKNVFGQIRETRKPQPKRPGGQGGSPAVPRVSAPQDAEAWICAPDHGSYTLLLAPVGISARKLRRFAEGHNTGAPTGVVLVTTRRGSLKLPLPAKG